MKDMMLKTVFISLLLLAYSVVFAGNGTIDGLEQKVNLITGLVNEGWLKGIAGLAFAVEAGALIFAGRNEPGIIKKFIPWMVGTVGILSAASIAEFMWKG